MYKLVSIFIIIILFQIDIIAEEKEKKKDLRGLVKRYIDSIILDTISTNEPQLILYPSIAYSPETSWEFGINSLLLFYANKDTNNRLSEVNGFSFYTLENQFGFWFDHAFYLQDDSWISLGKLRIQSFPLFYHGIGTHTPEDYIGRIDGFQFNLKESILKKIYKDVFVGLEFNFNSLSKVDFLSDDNNPKPNILGIDGSTNYGLGLGIVYDTRHNVLNVRDGAFNQLYYLRSDESWGSDYNFSTIISDNRIYKSLNERTVWANQLLGQFNWGDVPFNQMALMGGESIMRGYYLGRYRDLNQLAAQTELRFLPFKLPFTKRLGGAVFGSVGAVFPNFNSLGQEDFTWSVGGGLRYLLFQRKDIYTRLDVAYTKEGFGIYFFIGEAF